MKNIFFILVLSFITLACSKSDDGNNNRAHVPNQSFDTGNTINTTFPQYNDLIFAGNSVVVPNFGLNGISIYFTGSGYVAFELTDPDHVFQSCSKLTVEGIIATCGCSDAKQYNIINGQAHAGTTAQYALKPYFVEVNGSVIRVFNN
ncbi:MAG: hypothetical protein ACPG6B_02945 [Oceanihabitans sp.]